MDSRVFTYIDRPPTNPKWRDKWKAVLLSPEGHPVATLPDKQALGEKFYKRFMARLVWGVEEPIKGLILPQTGDRFALHDSGHLTYIKPF